MAAQERMCPFIFPAMSSNSQLLYREKAGQDQMHDFLETGIINQYCDAKEGCIRDTCTIIQ